MQDFLQCWMDGRSHWESEKRLEQQMSAAGIAWFAEEPQTVPPLRWTAACSVQKEIIRAFEKDALRGLPKRVVPDVIKRQLALAFEGKP